jgi:hypothetical protein
VVTVLATGPTGLSVAGSGPAEDSGFLWVIKLRTRTSFRGEVTPSVPCRIFTTCKRNLQSMIEMLFCKISRPLFLTGDSPASLPDGSGCWIRMIRLSVFRWQPSRLLLICTNLGHGNVLTAACALRGCSASDYYYYYYYYHHHHHYLV